VKTDPQLKQDIERELSWDPKINAAQIDVSVDKGTVAVMGEVGHFEIASAVQNALKWEVFVPDRRATQRAARALGNLRIRG
jgi:osmotically-inducible protein OsmY